MNNAETPETVVANENVLAILQRIFALLNARERRVAVGLLILVLVNSAVDLLGLAAVIPVIGLIVEPNLIAAHPSVQALYDGAHSFGIVSEKQFLGALCLALVGAFAFKTGFGIWLNHIQTRFGFRVAHRLSGVLWMHHFSDSLERMRSKESGRVLTEINSWPVLFARVFVTGGQLFFNEVMVMVLLAVGLTAYDPLVFLGVSGIIGAGALLIRIITRRRLRQNSATIQHLAPSSTSIVQNAVRGFLELITFGAVKSVRNRYLQQTQSLYAVHSRQMVLGIVPTRLYEFLAVTALCGIILFSLWMDASDDAFLESLSLLALSAYRVMPAMARINARLIAMRGQMHLLASMERGTNEQPDHEIATASPRLSGPIRIRVKNLELAYGSNSPVVSNLNAEFNPGAITVIAGPSGSGKSTLVSALLGLHQPNHGVIAINDQLLGQEITATSWLASVAYLSQHPFLFAGSVRENLTLGADMQNPSEAQLNSGGIDEVEVLQLIEQLGLTEALGPHPLEFILYEGGSNLSGGQQQRLALIRALRLGRAVLVLDEATSGLDGPTRDQVMAVLERYAAADRTVILITHDEAIMNGRNQVVLTP